MIQLYATENRNADMLSIIKDVQRYDVLFV